MKTRHRLLLCGLFAVLLAPLRGESAPAAEPKPAGPPLSPRFQQVRNRIEALFQHRLATPPPPDPQLNPFRPPGAPLVAAGDAGGPDADNVPVPLLEVRSSALELLQQSMATLKVNGTMIIGGRIHLVVNAKPYREGEMVQVQLEGEPFYLRLHKVSRNSVTFALHGAEMTLKF